MSIYFDLQEDYRKLEAEVEQLRKRYSAAVEVGGEALYDAPFPNGAEAADAMAAFERLVDTKLERETEAE